MELISEMSFLTWNCDNSLKFDGNKFISVNQLYAFLSEFDNDFRDATVRLYEGGKSPFEALRVLIHCSVGYILRINCIRSNLFSKLFLQRFLQTVSITIQHKRQKISVW